MRLTDDCRGVRCESKHNCTETFPTPYTPGMSIVEQVLRSDSGWTVALNYNRGDDFCFCPHHADERQENLRKR